MYIYVSSGVVYLATLNDSSLLSTSTIAVKSTNIIDSQSHRKEAKFLQELRGCPNVVQCFGDDISTENGETTYNLLFEYARGGTLHDMIKNTKKGNTIMPESDVARYVRMLLEGLCVIHENEIVHRDLKPKNILVFSGKEDDIGGNVRLKISDLGLAKKIWEAEVFDGHVGTLMYSSPESVSVDLYEKATDIWSLGCTVLEMFTGRQVWSYRDTRDLVQKIKQGKPKIPENISQDGKDFLRKCLERDHDKRWTTEMLLDHSFLDHHRTSLEFRLFGRNLDGFSGFGEWISKQGLFSTRDDQLEPQVNDDDLCKSIEPLSMYEKGQTKCFTKTRSP